MVGGDAESPVVTGGASGTWAQFWASRGPQASAADKMEVVLNRVGSVTPSRSEGGPRLWLHAPAYLELLAATRRLLVDAARARGLDVKEVAQVRAGRFADTEIAFIYPTIDNDPNKIATRIAEGHLWMNLRTVLGDRPVAAGYRERYETWYFPDSPIGPAVVFDMSTPERRVRLRKPRRSKPAQPDVAAE